MSENESSIAASSYTTDITYPSRFGATQTPIHLSYIAACRGFLVPDVRQPFHYCDLACGDGTTLLLIADCYPHAQFVGIDLNVEHINKAKVFADEAGLKNINFYAADVCDLESLGLPQFDFVTIAGAYSWLSEPARKAIHGFLDSNLRDHGLFFVHYASQPGAAQLDAFYQYVQLMNGADRRSSNDKFRKAIASAKKIREYGGIYFKENELASKLVELASNEVVGERTISALAHEALNARQHSFYFHELQDTFSQFGLSFVGRASAQENYLEIVFPASLQEVIRATPTQAAAQLAQDLISNTKVRRDIFCKAENRSTDMAGEQLNGLWLCQFSPGNAQQKREELTERTAINFLDELYRRLMSVITVEPKLWGDIRKLDALKHYSHQRVMQGMEQLVAVGLVNLVLQPFAVPTVGPNTLFRLTSRLNRHLINNHLAESVPTPLAARAGGTQLLMPPNDRTALYVLTGGGIRQVWQELVSGPNVPEGAKTEEAFERFSKSLDNNLPRFREVAAPHLLTLGIIEVVS